MYILILAAFIGDVGLMRPRHSLWKGGCACSRLFRFRAEQYRANYSMAGPLRELTRSLEHPLTCDGTVRSASTDFVFGVSAPKPIDVNTSVQRSPGATTWGFQVRIVARFRFRYECDTPYIAVCCTHSVSGGIRDCSLVLPMSFSAASCSV